MVKSENGLLTTIGYKLGDGPTHYALEGSIAVTGSLIQWLRDNLGIISSAPEVETLAKTVDDNGGAYFVPAFSGLFAPYWRSDARGALVGLTRYVNKGHIARAALEATAFQTREVLDAVNADSGVDLTELKVDGGMTANERLMQFQADILGVPVVRPVVAETTALGAAYAAGLAVGFWENLDDLRANWQEDERWTPNMDDGRARPSAPPLEEGRHEDLRLGRRRRQLTLTREHVTKARVRIRSSDGACRVRSRGRVAATHSASFAVARTASRRPRPRRRAARGSGRAIGRSRWRGILRPVGTTRGRPRRSAARCRGPGPAPPPSTRRATSALCAASPPRRSSIGTRGMPSSSGSRSCSVTEPAGDLPDVAVTGRGELVETVVAAEHERGRAARLEHADDRAPPCRAHWPRRRRSPRAGPGSSAGRGS